MVVLVGKELSPVSNPRVKRDRLREKKKTLAAQRDLDTRLDERMQELEQFFLNMKETQRHRNDDLLDEKKQPQTQPMRGKPKLGRPVDAESPSNNTEDCSNTNQTEAR